MEIAWPDLVAALGLVLVIEGLLPFLSPAGIRRMATRFAALDDSVLRIAGAVSMLGGLLLLWLARA